MRDGLNFSMKRLQYVCLSSILLIIAASASAEGEGTALKRSIALVFDLSYSMLTVELDAGASRYARGVDAVEKLTEGAAGSEEWVCILAEDAGTTVTAGGYTTDYVSLLTTLKNAQPWGTTSLEEMIRAGMEQLTRATAGTERYLFLVTDGINTDGRLYDFPVFDQTAAAPITLVVLSFSIGEYEGFRRAVSAWVEASGGIYLLHYQTDQLRRVFDGGRRPPADTGVESKLATKERSGEPDTLKEAPVLFPIWWIFLFPVAGAGAYMVRLFFTWSAVRRAFRNAVVRPREVVTLAYGVQGGETATRTFDNFPVKIAGSGDADLVLEKPRISTGARAFSIVRDEEGFRFSASGTFVINGVGRRDLRLRGGERIHFGRYRLVFEGVSHISPPPIPLPAPRFLLLLIPLAVFMIFAVVFREPVAIGRSRASTASESPRRTLLDHEGSDSRDAKPGNLTGEAAASEVTDPVRAASVSPQSALSKINTFPTVMWDPGVLPEFFKVDVLFFHAHPDDETLDFGILLRRLADAGKRTAVVIFTDGGAGIDQYPRRKVGEGYPAHDLRGKALADVRQEEAKSAMSILGVSHYVRLGLKNNPYRGVRDVKTVGDVIAAWGGESAVVTRLASLIAGYRPEIVVSPEGPGKALEHFEHETVGLLVEAALKRLERYEGFVPAGRVISIDPLQKALYPDALGVHAVGIDGKCGLSYRAVQAAALSVYRTQRDASVIGVENLSGFDNEYYKVLTWALPISLENYLTPS